MMFMLLTEMGTEYKYSGIYIITNTINDKVYVHKLGAQSHARE